MGEVIQKTIELPSIVQSINSPVTTEEIDNYGKLQEIADRSYRLRVFVDAWKEQQNQDRDMREKYAKWLLIVVTIQMTIIIITFFLIGFKFLVIDEWTARTFIVSIFSELSALVLIVFKYLFPKIPDSSDLINKVFGKENNGH